MFQNPSDFLFLYSIVALLNKQKLKQVANVLAAIRLLYKDKNKIHTHAHYER